MCSKNRLGIYLDLRLLAKRKKGNNRKKENCRSKTSSPLVKRHVIRYNSPMIKSFADKRTEMLFMDGSVKKLPPDIAKRAVRKLDMIDNAFRLEDLRVPPGNRLHALSGSRAGQWAISVNDQWRICFRFEGEDAFDVELCDYH